MEGGNKCCFCLSVCLSVAYIATNSRTQRPRVSKFRTKVPHLRCDSNTSFKVKRSRVTVGGGRGIPCRPNPTATLLVSRAPSSVAKSARCYTNFYFLWLHSLCYTGDIIIFVLSVATSIRPVFRPSRVAFSFAS